MQIKLNPIYSESVRRTRGKIAAWLGAVIFLPLLVTPALSGIIWMAPGTHLTVRCSGDHLTITHIGATAHLICHP